MTFEENPFSVLQVSIYDTKATIIERADDLSFADPDREEIIERARDILLNPRKRIAAEMRWFVGCSREQEKELMTRPYGEMFLFLDDLYLAETNRLIYSLKYLAPKDKLNIVSAIDASYSLLNAEKILKQINAARAKSKFPAVQDTVAIRSEMKNIRYDVREIIHDTLKVVDRVECIKQTNDFVEAIKYLDDGEFFGVIVEDFFDSCRLEMNPFFDEKSKQIISLLSKIKIRADKNFLDELVAAIESFAEAIKPLDKFSIALGTNNFDATEEIFYAVRDVAIKLFNEKKLIDEPLILSRRLEKNFSYLPSLVEVIRKDIKFLEKEKASRPTQSFLDAKAAFDKIQQEMDKYLQLKKGFEQSNLDFYLKVFKPTCDVMIKELMLPGRYLRRPKEWTALNAQAAVIYLHIGTALTWTRRADLAFELFQKATPYAEKSGDMELISLARKRVEEWQEINRQIYANSNSSGCFSVVAVVAVVFLLM